MLSALRHPAAYRSATLSGICALIFIGLLLSWHLTSYAASSSTADERIVIAPGEIFEIMVDTENTQDRVSWILMRGGQFLQAERQQVFSLRPTDTATYILQAEYVGQDNEPQRHVIEIVVSDQATKATRQKDAGSTFVSITPAPQANGSVTLTPGNQIIRIEPVTDKIEQMFLDLSVSADSNGDGNALNDNVLGSTVFKLGRSKLYIWFPSKLRNRAMVVGARLTNGRIVTKQVSLASGQFRTQPKPTVPPPEPPPRATSKMLTEDLGDNQYSFSIKKTDDLNSVPLLYHWDFGDGEQSILDRPKHTFAAAGTYQVTATVRDLGTSEEILTTTQRITVTSDISPGTKDISKKDDDKKDTKDKKDKKKGGFGSILWMIVKIITVLAISIGVGIGAMLLLSKVKGKSLKQVVAETEKKVVGEPKNGIDIATPMALSGTDDAEQTDQAPTVETAVVEDQPTKTPEKPEIAEASAAAIVPSEPPAGAQSTRQEATPAWLQDAPATAPTEPTADQTPDWMQTPADTSAAPDLDQTSAPQDNAQATPDWMQTPSADTASGAPPLEPQTTPTTENADTPPWLQPSTESSAQVQTDTAPIAEPTQEPPPPTDTPPVETPGEQSTVPPWMDQSAVSETQEAPLDTPVTEPAVAEPAAALEEPVETSLPADTVGTAARSPEDKERERKRKKRQRYRANKRARAKEENATEGTSSPAVEVAPSSAEETAEPSTQEETPPWLAQAEETLPPTAPPPEPIPTPEPQATVQETQAPTGDSTMPPWLTAAETPSAPEPVSAESPATVGPEGDTLPPTAPMPLQEAPPAETAAGSAETPLWITETPGAQSPAPPPIETAQTPTPDSPPAPETQVPAGDSATPPWLAAAETPPAPEPMPMESPTADAPQGEGDVKFMISADSVNGDGQPPAPPPPQDQTEEPPPDPLQHPPQAA